MTYQATEHWELTSFQKELWLAHLALPEAHPGISNGGIFTIEACLDKEVIREVLGCLKACFPLSSATLRSTKGRFPVFEIHVHPEPDILFKDFRSEPDPESAARQWLDQFKEKPFSPLGGSLYRCALIYLTDELSWFANYCFHLAGDGFFSISQVHLMMAWYDALKNGKPFRLPPAPPWQEDVAADREYQASSENIQHREEWASYLKGLPPERIFTPRIRTGKTRTKKKALGPTAHFEERFSAKAVGKIRELSKAYGVNQSHIFIALHLVVLSRLYDTGCINIQVPLRFGERRDFRKIQGHRVQIAPLIAHMDEHTSFASLIDDTRTTFKRIAKLKLTPFQETLRTLTRGRDMSHIWDTNINFIPYIVSEKSKYPLNIRSNISSRHEQLVLGVYLIEQSNQDIVVCIDYSTDFFNKIDIGQYVRRLEATAKECLENPDTPVMNRNGLLSGEIKMLDNFQPGPVFDPGEGTLPFCFDEIASKYRERPAVKSRADSRIQTYGQLRERSDGIGTWLAGQGLKPGQVVAVLTERHPDLPAVILGIMKAGGIYLPIDPDYPGERIRHMLADSGTRLILSTESAGCDTAADQWPDDSPVTIPDHLPGADPATLAGLSMDPSSPAYLIYTSGSTGLPKGVMVSHQGFMNMTRQQIAAFDQTCRDRVLQFASPSFDAAMAETFSALLSGGCLFPVPRDLIDDPPELKAYMEDQGVSVVTFPPSYLRLFDKTSFKGLKVLITAGEPPILEDARHYGRQLRYFNAYGPTEASVCATVLRFDPDADLAASTIGKPIGNTRAYILDSRGRRKAPGMPGELCLGGRGLAIGYLNRPELNKERFTAFPHLGEDRLYRTGDLAAWSETGNLVLLGRRDDQLKIRGHRIEPDEINRALEALPQINQAACIGVSLPGGPKSLHAFLILEKESAKTPWAGPEEILKQLTRILPAHMIPSRFHTLGALPIAPTGKVDKKTLENLAMEPRASSTQGLSQGENSSDLEIEIQDIFKQVLGLPMPDMHSDFFALGGDSLLAIELNRLIFDTYGCRISIRDLMKRATVHSVAKAVEQHQSSVPNDAAGSIGAVSGGIPLNHGQQGIWAQEMALGPSAGYNMPFALDIRTDEAQINRFCTCLEKAFQTQPGFQCHVESREDDPFLKLTDQTSFVMEQVDLRQTATADAMAAQWFDTAIHTPFDLGSPPLARACLARLDDSRWQLLLVFHHLIADGQSIGLLLNICTEYMAGNASATVYPSVLEEFTRAEQAYLSSPEGREDLGFWKHLLAIPPPRLDLSHTIDRPDIKSRDGELLRQDLSQQTGLGLRALARKTGATLLGCFTGLILEFLKKRTGREDVALSVPVGLRDTPALAKTAGYFVNLMVIRAVPGQNQTGMTERILKHWEMFRSALAHSRYPFGLLMEALGLKKDPSRWPVTDIIATHIDTAEMLPARDRTPGMELRYMDLPFRGAKADYTFILHTRQDGAMGLVLEYDIHVATAAEAGDLADRFVRYLDEAAQQVLGPSLLSDAQGVVPLPDAEAETGQSGALLGRAWKKILGIEIPEHDPQKERRHFLLDGGDSIKAIQMAGFLKRNGGRDITPAQIFQSPLFKDLKRLIRLHAGKTNAAANPAPAPMPGEEIPLLPLQARLFQQQADGWENFYMILPIQLSKDVDATRIPAALEALVSIHDAFRLSFESSGRARVKTKPVPPVYETLNTKAADPVPRGAEKLFRALDPAKGRCFGAVLVKTSNERYLILGGHHLVLDAVSLDLCLRDLAHFCRTGQLDARPRPGMAAWAKAVSGKDCELPALPEIDFWRTVCAREGSPLKGLIPHGHDRLSERQFIRQTLPSGTFHLSPNPRKDLLASLGTALYEAGQDTPIFVTLEGHGREAVSQAPDISQAVGWFTAAFPVVLTPFVDPVAQAADLKKIFRQLPQNGLGYGFSRQHFPGDPSLDYQSQITLNYLGRFFSGQETNGFKILPQFTSPSVLPGLLPKNYRFDSPLDIRGCILPNGALEIILEFSAACLDTAWVRRLCNGWVRALEQVAESANNEVGTALTDGTDFDRISLLAQRADCRPEDIQKIRPPLVNQEGMLFQSLLETENQGSYTQQINFLFKGKLDVSCFKKAWHTVLNRHKALRTLYPFDRDGEWHCLTLKRAKAIWKVRDLSASPPSELTALRKDLLARFREQKFDLARGPLMRAVLIILGPKSHELSLCFHHILMDGWCLGILLDEVLKIYTALDENRKIDLPPAPDPENFGAFLTGFDREAAKSYWAGVLDGLSSPTFLASPVPATDRPFEGELTWTLDQETTQALQTHSAGAGVSWAILIQAAWAVLLGQVGKAAPCRDTVFGIISSGRSSQLEKMEKMVGLFIQTLPVRVRWQGRTPILALAKAMGQDGLARLAHEYYPLADIQQDLSLSPLFDHILVFETYPFESLQNADIQTDNPGQTQSAPILTGITGSEKHPYALSLSVIPGQCLTLRLTSGALPVSESLVREVKQNFEKILSRIGLDPKVCCKDLESMVEPRKTGSENLCTRFQKTTKRFYDTPALISGDGTPWTYGKLDRISGHIAAGLDHAGDTVAFSLPRNPMAVAVMLGILKTGRAYLPLDPKNPRQRNRRIMDIADCRTLILSRKNPDRDRLTLHFDCLCCEDLAEKKSPAAQGAGDVTGIDPAKPAYLMFTSGSTGEPKGVVVPHRAVLNLVTQSDFWQISPGEHMLQTGPLGFDASTLEIWGALLNGGTTCFIHDDDLLTPARLQKIVARERITLMWLTASLCNLLADETPGMFAPLRRLFVGGEALSPSHMQRIMAACPALELINGYGPTENTTFTTTHRVTDADIEKGAIPIGKPISNTRVYILDDDHVPVPDGKWGEICAAGLNLALGYAGRDDLTRQAFMDLPAPVGERVYKTGDIGRRRSDGVIEYKGRKDSQVKVRGYRIELSEVEATLTQIPWVKNAAVLAPQIGEYRSLVAWVQPDRDRMPDGESRIETQLKQHLIDWVPAYMIPDTIKSTDRFPITPNGKLDRKKLEQTFLDKNTATKPPSQTDGGETPVPGDLSAIHARVAGAFSEVLGKPVHGPDANFFRLGGQSLRAMRMILRLNQIYNIELNVGLVMKRGRVKDIAAMIHDLTQPGSKTVENGTGAQPRIPDAGTRESFPLSQGQERLWFLQRMAPENPVYGVPFVRRIHGPLDVTTLEGAVAAVESRHDALRLRVPDTFTGGELTQKIAPPGQGGLIFKDFSHEKDPKGTVAQEVAKALETAFEFGYDQPLFRAMVFKESTSDHVLLLLFHHMICDGWSGGILLKDLFQAYENGGVSVGDGGDPADSLRYVDYAAWQKHFLAGEKGRILADRCVRRLTALPGGLDFPVLDLPCSGRRSALRSHKGEVLSVEWPREREKALADLAGKEQTTLFCVLLTLVKIFLYRHTGQEDILVGVPAAGRDHWQLENLVGFFVNTLVLRSPVSPEVFFTDLLGRVKTGLEAALADQACPFERLVDRLDLERDASRNPLFDVFVSFEDREWEDPAPPAGLALNPYPIPHNHSKFDLSFYFRQTAEGLCMDIEYSTDLFSASEISAMATRLSVLADGAPRYPQSPVNELPLLTDAERETLLYTFNDTYAHIDFNQTIDGLFQNQVARNPDAIALRDDAGNVLTFGRLDQQVERMACHLASHGVRKGTPVCLCFERCFDLMISLFALMRIGAVYVPVVPDLPIDRVASMAKDMDGCMAFCLEPEAAWFSKINVPVIPWPDPPPIGPADPKAFQSMTDPFGAAYVIFTSGSTGRPKGVSIQHRSVINRIQWMQSCFPLDKTDVILQKTPISFDVSVWELFWWSWTGASLAQLPPGEEKDPDAIIRAVKRHKVTVMHFVPSMLRIFLAHIQNNPDRISDIQSLKYVFASGEALTPGLVKLFNSLLHSANGTRLENLYGPTEATVDVTWYSCRPGEALDSVPIGKPVSNTRVYILDQHLEPVPLGVAGEIYLSGIQVAQGYVNRPELNEKCFLDDPFVPANRMYRTGDQGRWLPTGDVEYLGRNDNQVKLRGYRIELGEVEAALERIPEVSQAIVRTGTLGGEPCLEAFLVCPEHMPLSLETVRKTAGQGLPAYMIPSLFYRLEQVPLNLNGKADRKTLKGRRLSTHSPSRPQTVGTAQKEPEDPVDRRVREIWQKVLPEAGPIHDHQPFFEAGGSSFLAVRLYELLEKQWPGLFTIATLFVHTSIEKQVACIRQAEQTATAPAPAVYPVPDREDKKKEPVAVIGMALRLADYESEETLWADLLGQVDHTGPMPDRRADELIPTMAALGRSITREDLGQVAFLDDISGFDCRRFGLSPADATFMDPEHRLFLETVLRALEDAGYGGDATRGKAVGVFAGASPSQTFKAAIFKAFPDRAEQGFVLNLPSAMASRPGYIKDWSGPACVVDTACSSSLKAVQDACQSLANGECDMALAGGAKVMMAPVKNKKAFSIQSADDKTRPFDENASGVGAGEGAVVFLLKPLSRALADQDAIRAVILGGNVNQDGRSAGMAAPNPLAQAAVIHKASQNAGIDLSSLDFFEAHGTATPMGDPIEIEGLTRAFALADETDVDPRPASSSAAVSSIKGHFGHLDAAAGALGIARAILSLEHGIIPGQIHFTAPNPNIDFERTRVFVPRKSISLEPANQPWRCGVSAFGLSGINVHLVLEQAPPRRWKESSRRFYPVCLSASSATALCRYTEAVLDRICARPEWSLQAIAGTLVSGRDHLPFRLGLVADTREHLLEKLLKWRLEFDAIAAATPVKESDRTVDLGGFDDDQSAQQAVQAFLDGATPRWPDSEPVIRLHLPTVPLDRIPCWPDFSAAKAAALPDNSRFLDKKIQIPGGWIFPVPVHDDRFWPVFQHRLYHRPTLVGMAAVSLFLEAFHRSAKTGNLPSQIRGLSWLHPLSAEDTVPDSVSVRISPADQGFLAVLTGCDTRGNWVDFSSATLLEHEATADPLDLEQALSGMSAHENPFSPNATGDPSDASVIDVGPRWDCRVCAWSSGDGQRIMARLELPAPFRPDLDQIWLHPAIMDVAASLGLDRPGMVPTGFGRLIQFLPLPARVFAQAVKTEQAPGVLKVDCTVWDALSLNCILTIKDLAFMEARAPKAQIHGLEWVRLKNDAPAGDQNRAPGDLMIVAETEASRKLMENLVKEAGNLGIRALAHQLPEEADDQKALAKQAAGKGISNILWLAAASRSHCWALPLFLKTLCEQGFDHPVHFTVVGRGALKGVETDKDAAEPAVDAALSLGVMLSMNQEEPQLVCRYIELDESAALDALLAEVTASAIHPVSPVFLDGKGDRYARKISTRLTPEETAPPLTDGGCVLFTGGLGAMSLTLAQGAPAMGASCVALLHRGPFTVGDAPPGSFRREQLTRLREQGITAKLFSCDVTDKASLAKTLDQVRQELGPVRGVIHTAGVPGDGFLIRKKREEFEAVLAPKKDGLRHLHELTLADPLSFFVMASSRTALTGAPGQSDYAAANAWMDAFALWRACQGLPALTINWNTWAKVGMAARNRVPAMPGSTLVPEQALPVLLQALASGQTQVVVAMPGETLQMPTVATPSFGPAGQSDTISETDKHLPLEQRILAIVARTLGYEGTVSLDDDFYALGGDSITGMQVVNRINGELGLTAGVADLFTHSRLKDFAAAVARTPDTGHPEPSSFTAPDNLDTYPVTREQRAVLKMAALSLPNTGYNLPQFLKLPDNARHKDLEKALKALIQRHEILRTLFVDFAQDTPAMRILAPEAVTRNFSLERMAVDDIADSASRLIHPFKPDHAPLFRTAWLDTKKYGPVLFFDIYHGLADAKTIEILFSDLTALWQNIPLAPIAYQFKDAAFSQNQAPEDDHARAYWLERFGSGMPLPKLNLPGDNPRPAIHTFAGANHLFEVPGQWISDIRRFVRQQETTTHVLVLSLWAVLLSKSARTREPVISVASDSRIGRQYEGVAGMFASLLPLKLAVDESRSLEDLLRHTHKVLADALRHAAFPLSRLLEELKPPMDPGRTHLSEVTFSYMNAGSEQPGPDDSNAPKADIRNFERINVLNSACKADIAIFASDTGKRISFAMEYYADYFNAARMARMGEKFLALLDAVIHDRGTGGPLSAYGYDATPTTPAGDVLCLFRQLFKDETIGETDSFFDLGGHSLLGLQLINRINETWHMELSIRDLFENPSPAKLAQKVSAECSRGIPTAGNTQVLKKMNCPEGYYPLSHAQQRLYVLQHTQGGDTAYNMPFVFEFDILIDIDRFSRALEGVCMRHEVLRTSLKETDTGIWQKIDPRAQCAPKIHRLAAGDRDKALALFADLSARAFDLNRGPLLRIVVCRLGDEHDMLLLLMHHIISDGWSMQVFFKDLMAFYGDHDLLPLQIQYKEYAVWQQRQNWEPHAAYWKKQLDSAPGRIHLPGDGPGKTRTLPAELCKQELAPELLDRLNALARQKGVSLATLLFTLFSTLLYRLTRQQDMVIGMGVAGRDSRELEALMGFFINILPIRVRMDDDTSLWDLLDQVHKAFLEALERQAYPFDLLVREVVPDRGQHADPLVNVMFEYQRYQDLEGINPEENGPLKCRIIDLYDDPNKQGKPGPAARHDLTFFIQDTPEGCIVRAEFDPGILTRDTVATWLKYFDMVLESVLEPQPENTIDAT